MVSINPNKSLYIIGLGNKKSAPDYKY